jgi:hypothetical protein
LLGFSGEECLAGDVQRDLAGERDASLKVFLASCGGQTGESEAHGSKETAASREIKNCKIPCRTCLAALGGEVTNKQHGPDIMDERETSPLSDDFILASFCGGGVSCCNSGDGESSAHSRGLMRRVVVLMRRLGRCRFLLPPLGGVGDREAEKTNDVVARTTGAGVVSLAAAEDVEPMRAHACPVERNPPLSVAPASAGFEESSGAAAPLPVATKDAMGAVGVNGCFGEAKKVRPLVLEPLDVGVSGPSGEAANTKPPLGVGPVGVLGRSGAAKNANMFPALLASDPPGVVGAFSVNANMFPAAVVGWIGRSPGANENSAAAEDPARDAVGESVGVGGGGGGGVPGAGSKGPSSSSILLRTEEAGRRQRRLRPASAAHGAEKATAECAGSMRSSARCRGAGGGVKKKRSSAMAMALRVLRIRGGDDRRWGARSGSGPRGWGVVAERGAVCSCPSVSSLITYLI